MNIWQLHGKRDHSPEDSQATTDGEAHERPLNGNQSEQASRLIQVAGFHLPANLPQQLSNPLLIGRHPTAMTFAPRLKEQATAQLGERCRRSTVRQIGASLKPTHHVVAIDGGGEAFQTPKLCLRIRDSFNK